MNTIETNIEELKRRSNIINDLAIDWQALNQLAPQVLNQLQTPTPEFKEICGTLINICDRAKSEIDLLKSIIPTFSNEE